MENKKNLKEISNIIKNKLGAANVVHTDVLIDDDGEASLRFDAYDEMGYKTHTVTADTQKNYKIQKL